MGNIVSYLRAKPGQVAAVEQTKLSREITEDTREKTDELVIIHHQKVREEPTPSKNEVGQYQSFTFMNQFDVYPNISRVKRQTLKKLRMQKKLLMILMLFKMEKPRML